MPAGSLLIFLGRLWHAGGANTSVRPRLGVIIDPALAARLPQRLQELLGFNQQP
jgi:Phytanoyl-CoA dioxygenase (PhyH)